MKLRNTKMKRVLSFALALMMSAGVSLTTASAAEETLTVAASNLPTTSLQNVAANKYVWSSSYEGWCGGYHRAPNGYSQEHLSYFPQHAVDNVPYGSFSWRSETAATVDGLDAMEDDLNPWIAVDLGKAYRMEFIDIYIESDMDKNMVIEFANEREDNPTEYIFNGTAVSAATLDHGALINPVKIFEGEAQHFPAGYTGNKLRVKIDNTEKYRYLRISRPEGNTAQMKIKEIMVYAQDKDNLMNLSNGKPMTLNAGAYGLQSENREITFLTDGVLTAGGNHMHDWCDYSRASIDLGKEFIVERIDVITPRGGDKYGHRYETCRGAYEIYGGTKIGPSTEEGDPYGEFYPHVVAKMHTGVTEGTVKLVDQPEYIGPAGTTMSHVVAEPMPVRYLTFRRLTNRPYFAEEIIIWGYEVPETETEVELEEVKPTTTTVKYEPTTVYYPFGDNNYYKIERIEVTGTEENLKDFEIYSEGGSYYVVHENERKIRIAESGEVEPGTTKLVFDTSAYNLMSNGITISRKAGNTTSDLFANSIKIYARKDSAMAEVAKGKTGDAATDGNWDTPFVNSPGQDGILIKLDKALPVCGVDIESRNGFEDMENAKAFYDILGSNDNVQFERIGGNVKQGVAAHSRNTITFDNDKAYKYIKVVPKTGEFVGTLENYMGLYGDVRTTGYDVIGEVRVYAPQSAIGATANVADFKFVATSDGSGDATTSLAGDYIGVSFTLQNTGAVAIKGAYSVLALYNADGSLEKVKLTPIEDIAVGGMANVAYGIENPLAANPADTKAAHFIWTMDSLAPVAGGKNEITHTIHEETQTSTIIYASADGSGMGSAASPASLSEAMELANTLKNQTEKDVTVMLAEGDYFFTSL